MFALCKAHWVAIVYEMRYINKAALPLMVICSKEITLIIMFPAYSLYIYSKDID